MKNTKFKKASEFAVIGAVVLLAVCSRDNNPFTNLSLAKAVVSCTVPDGGTVEIFSRETLNVALAVAGLIDSVVVKIESDRLWDGDTALYGGPLSEPPVEGRFVFSLCDTGWHEIDITVYLENKEKLYQGFHINCISPLSQNDVYGSFDDTIRLKTVPVHDADAVYHWDFGLGNVFESVNPSPSVVITGAGLGGNGYLWVSDVKNMQLSTKTAFRFSFVDTIGPLIQCVNSGFEGRDTVRTGASAFFLQVKVTDRGLPVENVSVNGGQFDITDGSLYVKMATGLDVEDPSCFSFQIRAYDREAKPNVSVKTLYIYHNSSLPDAGQGVRIKVEVPSGDTVISGVARQYLLGSLDNYSGDAVVLSFVVNGNESETQVTLGSTGNGSSWAREILLAEGENTVKIEAHNLADALLDEKSIVMFYDPLLVDTGAPEIISITINNEDADGLTVPDTIVLLRVVCFDRGSGISSVTVNSKAMFEAGVAGICTLSVNLAHSSDETDDNKMYISVKDGLGNEANTTVGIYQNCSPQISGWLLPQTWPILAGSVFVNTMLASDDDRDWVHFEKISGPPGLTISEDGGIKWATSLEDTGANELLVRYRDGISKNKYACTLSVADSAGYEKRAAFGIDERDFPAFVDAGDTVSVSLQVMAETGTPPYYFTALRRIGSLYEDIGINFDKFQWTPNLQDTGYQHFIIGLTDGVGHRDTLYPMILVVPPNRNFSLEFDLPADTLLNGVLDIRDAVGPMIVVVRMDDPDTSLVEEYIVHVSRAGQEQVFTVCGADSFLIELDPSTAAVSSEIISVSVEDRAGHLKERTLGVIYSGMMLNLNTSAGGAGIDETVYDFPLLVRLTDENFPHFPEVGEGGAGIVFSKPDGTVIGHDIERWDGVNGRAEIWVIMDTVRGGDISQYIQMSWMNNSDTGASASVFDTLNGFESAWHLGASLSDATTHDYEGTDHGTTMTEGIAGYCRSFDGYSDHISAARSKPMLRSTAEATIECWANVTNTSTAALVSVAQWSNGNMTSSSRAALIINDEQTGQMIVAGRTTDGQTGSEMLSTPLGSNILNDWHHFAGVIDYAEDSIFLFVDGELRGSAHVSFNGSGTPSTNSEQTVIGFEDDAGNNFLKGMMDEVRISRVRRSAAWIKLSYENQKPGSTVISVE